MVNERTPRRSAYWCFTWNNYPEGAVDTITALATTYFVIGKEVGENGTPHLQGYIELVRKTRMTTLKAETCDAIHWESRKGTGKEAADYCKKDGDFTEGGEIKATLQGINLWPELDDLPIR